jgi:hypothetical protein
MFSQVPPRHPVLLHSARKASISEHVNHGPLKSGKRLYRHSHVRCPVGRNSPIPKFDGPFEVFPFEDESVDLLLGSGQQLQEVKDVHFIE